MQRIGGALGPMDVIVHSITPYFMYPRLAVDDWNRVVGDRINQAMPASAEPTLPGYRRFEKIAEGGFGVTYKAEHIQLGLPVCVKFATKISADEEKVLVDEARAIFNLRHFGIPAVHDLIRTPQGLAMVMSYIPGPTITQIREKSDYKHGIDPEHIGWIADRLLNILKYLHMHGVVHGDIKPQNVIIQPKDHTVVLVDYGLSGVMPDGKTKTKGYTPYFAAPEQIDRKPPIPQSDYYSLGMLLVYALGGDVAQADVPVPANVPDAMFNFIKALIKPDPLKRPDGVNPDLCELWRVVRLKDFGSIACRLPPLKI